MKRLERRGLLTGYGRNTGAGPGPLPLKPSLTAVSFCVADITVYEFLLPVTKVVSR